MEWSLYTMHRRKDFYGEDAEEFKPERWETLRPGWEYLPFNGGPRICIGRMSNALSAWLKNRMLTQDRTIRAHRGKLHDHQADAGIPECGESRRSALDGMDDVDLCDPTGYAGWLDAGVSACMCGSQESEVRSLGHRMNETSCSLHGQLLSHIEITISDLL